MKLALVFATTISCALSANAVAETRLPHHTGGRIETSAQQAGEAHQWPGIYFETATNGRSVTLKFDDKINIYKLYLNGQLFRVIVRPGRANFRFDHEGNDHGDRYRLEKITESQSDTGKFLGFFSNASDDAIPPPARARQIEFIGDSFTVGYGNTSPKRECTTDEVWATTDTSQAFGPLTAKAYNADYQINAFSGRGVVRNYDGIKGDTLPVLHNYTLFDGKTEYKAENWQPQIIVIGLGTNDFSTALKPDEKWKTREDLRTDYRNTYVTFVKTLRAKNPKAQFILMASDQSGGEIRDQVLQVEKTLKSQGETQVDTIIFTGLDYAGCHAHPSVADDVILKGLLTDYIDARPALWQSR
ncbi:GDSL-type esterase/lipase family protein [Asticcacaulis sp. SL142]|uniref:SGNH/GDSL hydrolase family protein n=1 Tax=Asticcacaulis sp. SL142 TaxID=2995155 RepID=UPI00226D2502|nr:SGNH/GDSL hydrolase family protein [Asticcacaulis sp. SL142]WAC47958.1 GDSL-type esterase/lipase family protein [Asticcacaulis sp. SL142]